MGSPRRAELPESSCRAPLGYPARVRHPVPWLFLAGLVIHGLWATTISVPVDWDPQYYGLLARRILAGEGATLEVVWTLAAVPESLPMPADLHWMPLASRVLLPGLAVWPEHGDQAISVLLAALWAPAAWQLAGTLGLDGRLRLLAGLLCLCGGGYVRFLSTPDSLALYGVIGSAALLAASRGAWVGAAGLVVAAALTRGDGFLLGLGLGLAMLPRSRWGGVLLGASGLLSTAFWQGRGLWISGDLARRSREVTAQATDMGAFLRGELTTTGPLERVLFLLSEVDDSLRLVLVAGVGLVPLGAVAGAWLHRRSSWVRAAAIHVGLLATVPLLLAPAVAASGTLFRSGSSVFPAGCALCAAGVGALSRWAEERRGYPSWLLPGLLLVGAAVGSVGVGLGTWRAQPPAAVDCAAVPPDALVASSDPLTWARRCGVPAVYLPPEPEHHEGARATWAHLVPDAGVWIPAD